MKLNKLVSVSIFVALGLVLSPFIKIDLGFAKAFPLQHMINVFIAVFFGVSYNLAASFSLSSLRVLLGTGTILAYPGSMIGAVLSAFFYKKTNSLLLACIGEVIGTGVIGGYIAYLVATLFLGKNLAAMAMIVPFLTSSTVGAVMAFIIIRLMPATLKEQLKH